MHHVSTSPGQARGDEDKSSYCVRYCAASLCAPSRIGTQGCALDVQKWRVGARSFTSSSVPALMKIMPCAIPSGVSLNTGEPHLPAELAQDRIALIGCHPHRS